MSAAACSPNKEMTILPDSHVQMTSFQNPIKYTHFRLNLRLVVRGLLKCLQDIRTPSHQEVLTYTSLHSSPCGAMLCTNRWKAQVLARARNKY